MIDRTLRARVLLEEARALGLDLADLIVAHGGLADRVPTVAAFVDSLSPTFTPATAATYRPYWRLGVERFGDRRLHEIGLDDLVAVVAAAEERARRNRPGSTGRASREACVAAWRALFARAAAAGLVTANPAAALTKPLRARRQGALDLRCRDLDPKRATVWLREKDDTEREQPVSPSPRPSPVTARRRSPAATCTPVSPTSPAPPSPAKRTPRR